MLYVFGMLQRCLQSTPSLFRLWAVLLVASSFSLALEAGRKSKSLKAFSLEQALADNQITFETPLPRVAIEADLAESASQLTAAHFAGAKIALQDLEGFDTLESWFETQFVPQIAPVSITIPVEANPSPRFTQGYWNDAIARRTKPILADRYIPIFKKAFESKGVPAELAWLSEVESSITLQALSPVGAYGPFQFMPATAERFGLRVGTPDDRTDPHMSAKAAATYLNLLHRQFQSWPLALAAYNAGEGRVGRTLKKHQARTFSQIPPHLPTETRMFVHKVLATVATRESIDPWRVLYTLRFRGYQEVTLR